MRALRFNEFGDPAVLHVTDMPDPPATAQEAVIRVEAASVNPSDVKNVAGQMESTILPRIPGRDFAGVVSSGPPEWEGAAVWGTGGDVSLTRDGSHAQLMSVQVDALVRKPQRLSFDEASSVGVNFVVGWYGTVETAQLAVDKTIAIFGVSGGVGGAVAQIANALGASSTTNNANSSTTSCTRSCRGPVPPASAVEPPTARSLALSTPCCAALPLPDNSCSSRPASNSTPRCPTACAKSLFWPSVPVGRGLRALRALRGRSPPRNPRRHRPQPCRRHRTRRPQ